MDQADYSGYFSSRGISLDHYRDHKLPPYLLAILPADKHAAVLDFGCGFGQNLFALRDLGYDNLNGYDIEPQALQFLADNGLHALDGRTTGLPAVPGRFDLILLTHVLEHLPKDQVIATLSALRNKLKPDGRLFIAVPNAQSHTGAYWMYEDFTHHTLFTAGSLFYVLRQAGFSRVRLHDQDCLMGVRGLKRWVRRLLLALYRSNHRLWNRVTGSSYHGPSPVVYSYEVKAIAQQ